MLAALLSSNTAFAQLKICGNAVDLTASGTQTITGSGISGTVTYDASEKRLDLTNATLTSSGTNDGIYNASVDGLTIYFHGTVNINTNSSGTNVAALYLDKKTTLSSMKAEASPVVNLKNTGSGPAFKVRGSAVSVWGLNITAQASSNDAVAAVVYNSTSPSLAMHFSQLAATAASGKYAFTGFTGGLSLSGSEYQSGHKFDTSSGDIVNSSGTQQEKTTIYPSIKIGKYFIANNGDRTLSAAVTGASSAAGTTNYNSSTKTLTLTGLNVNGAGIVSRVSGLKIVFSGGATLTNSAIAMDLFGDTEITSDGTVSLTATSSSAIYLNGAYNLTVNMPELNATSSGNYYGVNGSNYSGSKLTLTKYNNSSVYKFLGGKANLSVGSLVMNDMDIWTPHTYFNQTEHKLYYRGAEATASNGPSDGSWFKGTNQFTYYPVYVAGVQANNRNCDDITGQYITGGTASYDNSSKTLTLNNIQIDVAESGVAAVKNMSSAGDFTLEFTGSEDAHLTSQSAAIDVSCNTTITGTSNRVYVESTEGSGIITRSTPSYFTIDVNGYFGAKGKNYGYFGENSETLTLKKKTSDTYGFRFEGEEGALHAIKDLVLDNMDYGWQGNNGYYFDNKEVRQNGGNAVKGVVEFGSIQEKLPISICGKQLNRVNTSTINVGSPYISSGTKSVSYNADSKTLTLNNATMDVQNGKGIALQDGFDGSIELKGTNKIIAENGAGIVNDHTTVKNTTFKGDGSLYVESKTWYALQPWVGTMTITDNVTIEAKGASDKYGIGNFNGNGTLVISGNAQVKASNIGGIGTITLQDGQAVVEPQGATVSGGAVMAGGSVASNVVIMKVEDYGLKVCDIAVNSYNCNDILGDGKFKYNPDSKTLFINGGNVQDAAISDLVCNESVDGLIVNIQGYNKFTVDDNIFKLYANTTLTGTGRISGELIASDGYGIYVPKSNVTLVIDGPDLEFTAQRAIGGESTTKVYFNSGKLSYEPYGAASDRQAIYAAELILGEGMYITTPDGATFSPSLLGITKDGSTVYQGGVVIQGATAYDLSIGGKAVNSVNCGNILGDGVFKYDAGSKTLTINGNYTYTTDANFIESYIDDLTINVAGNSTLVSSANSWTIIRLRGNTTITGGKLTLMSTASDNGALGIYIDGGSTLTLKDAEIDVTGDCFNYGITGNSGCKLVIDNCDIRCSAHGWGAIYDWGGITLTNCYVDEPRPSNIDANGIQDGEGNYVGSGDETETVVIKRGADAINNLEAQPSTLDKDVYDVAGRKLDQTRRGVNIIRTTDGKTRKVVKK